MKSFKMQVTNNIWAETKKVKAETSEMAVKMVNGLLNSAWHVMEETVVEVDEMKEALKEKYYKLVKLKEEAKKELDYFGELYEDLVWGDDAEALKNWWVANDELVKYLKEKDEELAKMRERFFSKQELKEMSKEYKAR